MKGTSKIRAQGYGDPALVALMRRHGLESIPLYDNRPPETEAKRRRWTELAKFRDGPVNPTRIDASDAAELTATIKDLARSLGADELGCTRLTPIMLDRSAELDHEFVICILVGENYARTVEGPRAIESESTSVYVKCAEISTSLAAHIRSLGFSAIAHHNGAGEIQAIPAMHASGLGELGKHGSLIHPKLGASFRPSFVTTTLPLVPDDPIVFGVQDTCIHCNLCANNCPGDAIPQHDYIITEGVKRWLTDVDRCYVYSRLRPQYCHICVDACPYVHKASCDPIKKEFYKRYMRNRKQAGYKTPAWFPEDRPEMLKD